VNLFGAFRRFLKFPKVFKNAGKNNIKIKEKREFLRKIDFGFRETLTLMIQVFCYYVVVIYLIFQTQNNKYTHG